MIVIPFVFFLLASPSFLKSTRHVQDQVGNNLFDYHHVGTPTLTTPTMIFVHGLLDDFCLRDTDCSLDHSVCSQRTQRCVCTRHYIRTKNKRGCKLNKGKSQNVELVR